MNFKTPNNDVTFEIPDDWWHFAEMKNFSPNQSGFYLYRNERDSITVVPILQVEPPKRNEGVPLLFKHNLLPILFGFTNPECTLPPVEVIELP